MYGRIVTLTRKISINDSKTGGNCKVVYWHRISNHYLKGID